MSDKHTQALAASAAELEQSFDKMTEENKLHFFATMVRLARCYVDDDEMVGVLLLQERADTLCTLSLNASWNDAARIVSGAAMLFVQNALDMAEAREHAH